MQSVKVNLVGHCRENSEEPFWRDDGAASPSSTLWAATLLLRILSKAHNQRKSSLQANLLSWSEKSPCVSLSTELCRLSTGQGWEGLLTMGSGGEAPQHTGWGRHFCTFKNWLHMDDLAFAFFSIF